MKCPLCEKQTQPKMTETLETGYIIRKWQCLKCHWFFKFETIPFEPRRFQHIKEILKKIFDYRQAKV